MANDGFGARLLLLLGVLSLSAGGAVLYQQSQTKTDDLSARVITTKAVKGWKVLNEVDAQSGATIPPDMNVVFRLPQDMESTTREVLLGQKGKQVRYWGYCFGENFTEETVQTRVQDGKLPGRVFLSEAERDARKTAENARLPRYTAANPPSTQAELDRMINPDPSPIQNQLDVFDPGMVCYIMTSAPLAFGVDSDGDLLNNKLEREINTEIAVPDTDRDGITDGVEYLHGSLPKVRDSDGDGLIDGLEDKNWNGNVDRGETSVLTKDSDKDGLCDGVCRVKFGRGTEQMLGEDMNLNGQVDGSETDPLKWSSRSDGVSDYQAYLNCKLGQKQYCQ